MENLMNSPQDVDLQPYIDLAVMYGLKLLAALAIFMIGRWVAKRIASLLEKAMTRAKIDVTLVRFLGNIAYGLMVAFVVIAALSQVGIETASLAAIIAAAGLAIGLALQGSLSNFAAGVMLILFRPFKSGDYVEAAGTAGTVEEVSILTTVLKTPNNEKVIAPNSAIFSGIIKNFSAYDIRRIDMTVGVGYDDDLEKVAEVLQQIIDNEPRVLKDPAPAIAVKALGDSSVNFAFRPWVKSSDFWPVQFELTKQIKMVFDKEGISIPFPQRDIHIINGDAEVAKKAA